MIEARYRQVDEAGAGLTTQEIMEGWHFCGDWDGLLIGPGWGELEACTCFEPGDPRHQLVLDMRLERARDEAEMVGGLDLDKPPHP